MNLFRNKKVMVVVAHPDDELLGLGGSMHRLINQFGVITQVLILGSGISSRYYQGDNSKLEGELLIHRKNIKEAQIQIGYHNISTYQLPDNRFDTYSLLDLIKIIEKEKKIFEPDIIFTHNGGDINVDHQKTFEAVMTACRPMAAESVQSIFSFETPSSTEWHSPSDPRHFVPNFFIEISEEDLFAKVKGLNCYVNEIRDYPHPRSAAALKIIAQRWGISIGVE